MHAVDPVLDSTFEPIDQYPGERRIAIASLNASADALPDVAVCDATTKQIRVYLNGKGGAGTGKFPSAESPISLTKTPRDIAAADLNADGKIDLAVALEGATAGEHEAVILLGDGSGAFPSDPARWIRGRLSQAPARMAAKDFECDLARRVPDLAVACATGVLAFACNPGLEGDLVFEFADAPGGPPRPSGIGSGDLDNDKDVDPEVTVTGSNGANPGDGQGMIVVFANMSRLGKPAFKSVQTLRFERDVRPMGLVLADFCGDGFLDVATIDAPSGRVSVRENLGGVYDGWLGLSPTAQVPHLGEGAPRGIAYTPMGKPGGVRRCVLTLRDLKEGGADLTRIEALERSWGPNLTLSQIQRSEPVGNPSTQVLAADLDANGYADAVTAGGYYRSR